LSGHLDPRDQRLLTGQDPWPVNGHHEAAAVEQWLADKKDRIEVFLLPKYAPERNPDEYLNCDIKANINPDGLPKDREELQGKLHRFMQRLAKLPARIASYFEHKYIEYAAVPELNLT
jgi:hypothetical protein